MSRERVGILGGSFDPVHNGHLLLALAARERCGLDRLLVIPAARSPFKAAAGHAPDAERLHLLRAAFAGLPGVEIEEIEVQRGGVSYTLDTVRALAARSPDAHLHLIVGSDALRGLPRWHEAATLVREVRFLVAQRPGAALPDLAPLREELPGLEVAPFAMPQIDLSSREVRARVAAGLPIHGHVPESVAARIAEQDLYRDS